MRVDRFIDNDSGAYSIIPSSVIEKVIDDGRENDLKFVKKHVAILQTLVGDDSFLARVVVDEPLTEAEQNEWISRVKWPLRVKCGKLLISGGFDPDAIAELAEDESSFINVPPGAYVVEVLTYLNTMNGRVFRERWGEQYRLGAWFRREHPDRPFPTWVASELYWYPEEDPGHEAEWKNMKGSLDSGKLRIDNGPMSWVGVIVHLTREENPTDLSELPGDGFFPEDAGLRRPERFPWGIPSDSEQVTVTSDVRELFTKD
jgi:hypothetical protein